MRAALICFTARGEVTMQAAAKALQKKGWETTSYVKRKAASHQKKISCEEEKYEIGSDTEEGTVTEANRENSTEKYVQETEENILEKTDVILCTESLQQWCKNMFSTCELLVFVGATGIAVRGIAPFVKDKRTDPAVLTMDESAAYVIPLLSGHIGGANELAEWLAKDLQATAVITTATDINHKIAIDVFARKNNLWISDMKLAKEVSADILQGKKILISADEEKAAELAGLDWPPELVFDYKKIDSPSIITREKKLNMFEKKQDTGSVAFEFSDIHVHIGLQKLKTRGQQRILYLVPKAAVLGIGCKKGTSQDVIQKQITEVLTEHGILEEAVDMAASIDLKASEPGLLSLTEKKGWKFRTFSAEELRAVPGIYQASAFVQSVTGVDNVCERSAKLASNYGKIIIEKHGACGVTVACAEKDWSVNL